MLRKVLRASGLVGAVLGLLACSLIVDTSEISAGCGAGKKFCDDKCVSVDEPLYGCSKNDCKRCGNLGEHTEVRCEDTTCVYVGCVNGWGCEQCAISLFTDPDNCGACLHSCEADFPGHAVGCQAGVCYDATPDDDGGVTGTRVAGSGGHESGD